MVGEREKPPKVIGMDFDSSLVTAKIGDGIEADTMKVNMRIKTVFAKFNSGHVQIFTII
jgi:uncharacterized OB-fold protein